MASFSQSQVDIGNIILSVGRSVGATDKQIQSAFAAAKVESNFANLNYGDRDSIGVFQQRPSQGWGTVAQIMNPVYAAQKYFEAVKKVSQSGTIGNIAQRVQRSAFPAKYDKEAPVALELYNRLLGGNASVTGNSLPTSNNSPASLATNSDTPKIIVYASIGLAALVIIPRILRGYS